MTALGISTPLPRAALTVTIAQTRHSARLVVWSTVILTVGMLLSIKLVDRFALSNVAQVASTILLLAAFPRLLRPRDIGWIALGLASAALGIFATSMQYEYDVSPTHTAYFLACTIHLWAIYRACRERGVWSSFAHGIRIAIPISLAIFGVMYAAEIAQGSPNPALGFDDKSHASVAGCFLAFASLRFLRSPGRILFALAFIALSLVTPSRLTFFFLPFFLVAFLIEYRRIRSSATNAVHVYFAHLSLLAAAAAPLYLALNAAEYFTTSFDRILDPNSVTESSTGTHFDLLRLGADIKLDSIANIVLGIGPGGFAGVASNSGLDLAQYNIPLYTINEGTAPLHSTLGSIILEFPLWVAIAYIILLVKVLQALVSKREHVLALFLCALTIGTMFYSSHNEVLFLVCMTVLVAAAYRDRDDGVSQVHQRLSAPDRAETADRS